MGKLKSTGERLTTHSINYTTIEHLHRYGLASELVKNKAVLDIASGEGYGSNLLAQTAKTVIGVDISTEAIAHATAKYNSANLKFIWGSADKIPCDDELFDVVVSFETIEHHDKHEEMMLEIKRVLKNDGLLIMSSPDKLYYTDIPQTINPYHIKELYESEFKELIKKHFSYSHFLKQRLDYLSVMLPENTSLEFECYDGSFEKIYKKNNYGPHYIVSIASNDILPEIKITPFFTGEKVIQDEITQLKNSWSYKLGHFILYPLRIIKRLCQKFL